MPNGLQFITENPVTGAFRRGQQNAREGRLAETKQAEADAIVAERLATAPERVEQSRLKTAADQFANRRSEVDANIAEGTQKQVILDANSARSDKLIGESIKLLGKGESEMAQIVATRAGEPIPDEVLRNRAILKDIERLWEEAIQIYPNRPRMQQQHVELSLAGKMDEKRRMAGIPRVRPDTSANLPAGAPEVPNASSVPSKSNPPADVEAAEWYAQRIASVRGTPVTDRDYLEAFEFIRQAKTDPTKRAGLIVRLVDAAMRDRRDRRSYDENIADATKLVDDAIAASQSSIGLPGASAPASTGNPPAPVDPADRVVGQTYAARNGQNVLWDGKGWKVAP